MFGKSKNPRNSHPKCSIKKVVLKNFAKFTGKHLFQSLFFNKVGGFACDLTRDLAHVFSTEICEIIKRCHPYSFCDAYRK